MKKSAWIWLVAAALAVQVAGLGWLAARYEQVVSRGTEVRIPCGAFDPVDMLRGRYLHVRAEAECSDAGDTTPEDWGWRGKTNLHALLEPTSDGAGTYRVARVAKAAGQEGLWIQASWVYQTWHEDEKKHGLPLRVGFPGKLFMDERLAKAADNVFAQRTGEAVAVYRVWKGAIVITDVEIDGISIKALARQARAAEMKHDK